MICNAFIQKRCGPLTIIQMYSYQSKSGYLSIDNLILNCVLIFFYSFETILYVKIQSLLGVQKVSVLFSIVSDTS